MMRPNWTASVMTLFPEMFPGLLGESLVGRARTAGIWSLDAIDIRRFAINRHGTVDDAPFGGGPGLIMRPDVIDAALDAVLESRAAAGHAPCPVIYLSPRGTPLVQARVRALAEGSGVVLLCGRYEGVDQRVIEARAVEEVSLGDFVLSGGEPAAICLIDACVRLLPGVLGAAESLDEESFTSGLLEYPHFTRPQDWRGRGVPEVLLSGHHERVREWRRLQAEEITRLRRPDLWARYEAIRAKARSSAAVTSERKG
jgi:tRNA (guanine37-N1)-methyltransferase